MYKRQVFRYLRSGLSGMAHEETDILENYVLALGIRGAKKWENRFVRSYRGLSEEELEQIDGLRQRVSDALIPFAKLQRKKHVTVRERTFAVSYTHLDVYKRQPAGSVE